jgi:hypothetical protein
MSLKQAAELAPVTFCALFSDHDYENTSVAINQIVCMYRKSAVWFMGSGM